MPKCPPGIFCIEYAAITCGIVLILAVWMFIFIRNKADDANSNDNNTNNANNMISNPGANIVVQYPRRYNANFLPVYNNSCGPSCNIGAYDVPYGVPAVNYYTRYGRGIEPVCVGNRGYCGY